MMVEYSSTLPVGVPKPYSSPVFGSDILCHSSGEGLNTGFVMASRADVPCGASMAS